MRIKRFENLNYKSEPYDEDFEVSINIKTFVSSLKDQLQFLADKYQLKLIEINEKFILKKNSDEYIGFVLKRNGNDLQLSFSNDFMIKNGPEEVEFITINDVDDYIKNYFES